MIITLLLNFIGIFVFPFAIHTFFWHFYRKFGLKVKITSESISDVNPQVGKSQIVINLNMHACLVHS